MSYTDTKEEDDLIEAMTDPKEKALKLLEVLDEALLNHAVNLRHSGMGSSDDRDDIHSFRHNLVKNVVPWIAEHGAEWKTMEEARDSVYDKIIHQSYCDEAMKMRSDHFFYHGMTNFSLITGVTSLHEGFNLLRLRGRNERS